MKWFTLMLAAASVFSCDAGKTDFIAQCGGLAKLSGKGYVAAIDCRRNAKPDDFAKGADFVASLFSITISNMTGRAFTLATAADQLKTSGGNVAVFIADDPAMPIALSAPEEKWAMLNAARVSADAPGEEKFRRRLSLLFVRQCCRVLGSDEAKGTDTCFHSIFSLKDLDAITSFDITMGPEIGIPETMTLRGIEKIEYGTYEEACMTGVAQPPTNDVQRAIWDKVHAIPKNPMKIEFDPKKGR